MREARQKSRVYGDCADSASDLEPILQPRSDVTDEENHIDMPALAICHEVFHPKVTEMQTDSEGGRPV
jgi:hypothetical protein